MSTHLSDSTTPSSASTKSESPSSEIQCANKMKESFDGTQDLPLFHKINTIEEFKDAVESSPEEMYLRFKYLRNAEDLGKNVIGESCKQGHKLMERCEFLEAQIAECKEYHKVRIKSMEYQHQTQIGNLKETQITRNWETVEWSSAFLGKLSRELQRNINAIERTYNDEAATTEKIHQAELEGLRKAHEFEKKIIHDTYRESQSTLGTMASLSPPHPDPDRFEGGDYPKLKCFLSYMAIKLKFNADWYPTESDKVAYFMLRLSEFAFERITWGVSNNCQEIDFKSVEEIITALKYSGPERSRIEYEEITTNGGVSMGKSEFWGVVQCNLLVDHDTYDFHQRK